MTKKEFEGRTGITLSDEQFTQINWMYVNAEDMQVDEFCQEYLMHGKSKLLAAVQGNVNTLQEQYLNLKNQLDELSLFLVDQAHECSSPQLRRKAIELLGLKKYLTTKLEKGYSLWSIDREDIISMINMK